LVARYLAGLLQRAPRNNRHSRVGGAPLWRIAASRGIKTLLLLTGVFLASQDAGAADPVTYTVKFTASGDLRLDALLKQTASLASLQKKLPPAPFALIGRARADEAEFLVVLHSLGYDSGAVDIRIAGKPLDDPTLLDALTAAPANGAVTVLITPHPGPVYHLGSVTINTLPAGFAAPPLPRAGDAALAAPVLDATGALRTALHNAGFAFATVSAPLAVADSRDSTLDVTYTVNAGPRVDIGAISFAGLTRTDADFLRRHIALRPGQQFSDDRLSAARDSLLALGVFSSVTPVPGSNQLPPGQVPVLFRVAEQKRHAVTLGAAYATDTGITISAAWADRNLFRHAETLTVTLAANGLGGTGTTSPGYDLKGVFAKPDYYSRGQTLTVSAEGVREFLTAYDRTAFLAGALLSRPLTLHIILGYGAGFITERVDQEGVSRSYVLGQIPLSLTYDTTDSLFEPTRGIRANVTLTPTKPIVGGAGAFLITQLTGSTYLAVEHGARGIIALRGLIGVIAGATNFQVPPDQRFYAGGSGTVRGFTYQTIGPLFADDKPEGGTAIDAATLEFRQRIGKSFGVVPFVDIGQVTASGKPFTGNLRIGAGIGARYYTGIGPIRVDLAVPLNRTPGSGAFALYIGLGEAF
jgi:translocation and assembly module TamA